MNEIKSALKPRVHRQVVETIAMAIIAGDYPPGGLLPSEAQLCEQLSVSRSALREAIKVLAGKGLVAPRPRTGTAIRERSDWNMLDPDLLAWSMRFEPRPEIVLSLIEARQVIEPAAARLAAMRATSADLALMEEAFIEMSKALAAEDYERFNRADRQFHTRLLGASHNFVFMQMSTTIGAALLYGFRLTMHNTRQPGVSLAKHGEVAERIRLRDPVGAEAEMRELLEIAIADLGLERGN